jgi:hypothetical protein
LIYINQYPNLSEECWALRTDVGKHIKTVENKVLKLLLAANEKLEMFEFENNILASLTIL